MRAGLAKRGDMRFAYAMREPPKKSLDNARRARLFAGLVAALALAAIAVPAVARDVLGVFQRWGAFRDPKVARCYAISKPVIAGSTTNDWHGFAAVGYWPRRGISGQINIRLSRELAPGSTATLRIGERQFDLTGGGADVWARDKQQDAMILAAIRAGTQMRVSGRTSGGAAFSDDYGLRGAATAIDAAALGCARLR